LRLIKKYAGAEMKKGILFLILSFLFYPNVFFSQNKIVVYTDSVQGQISKHIYGHFAEHLGRCIYGGFWVGEDSHIPNTRGIRNDVVKALKEMNIPNLRWPGGCFADTYHWMDGIGPKSERGKTVNTSWGGVVEDNSFGTHEFMDLCEQIGAEPVICGNIGSGTVKEMADWVEYLTSDAGTPMAELRKKNGREKPWKVKYWGIGNETWGCGGIMSADFYSNELSRYSVFLKNYGDNVLYKIASGTYGEETEWTETLMKKWSETDGWLQGYMSGYSLHHYTICHNWAQKGSATDFNEEEWFLSLSKTIVMDELIKKHSEIMDKYDPEKRIGLIVDEWGNWFDVEPGTNPAFLYQQNSLRDAMVAALNFDIFNKHCDRVKMANIAQTINVLQSVILTKDEQMVLTPTYYAFKMYKVHHDANLLPVDISCEDYTMGDESIKSISSSASVDSNGLMHITLTNVNPNKTAKVKIELTGSEQKSFSYGEIITAERINSYNNFGKDEEVTLKEFDNVDISGKTIDIELPAKSIVMIELK
jgi:alpha-N-arabinofuranosidase